jgi:hypothetical protein
MDAIGDARQPTIRMDVQFYDEEKRRALLSERHGLRGQPVDFVEPV